METVWFPVKGFCELMVSIGMRLRDERLRLGFNQVKLGEIGGVTKKTQILYENGERFPDARYLAAVAEAGVDVSYVVNGQRQTSESTLSDRESKLLRDFRNSLEAGKDLIEGTADLAARVPTQRTGSTG